MKRFSLAFALLAVVSMTLMADILITEDGDKIEAYEVELTPSYVYYKKTKESTGVERIERSKIMLWKKDDGSKVLVNETGDNETDNAPTQQLGDSHKGVDAKNENARRIEEYNAAINSFAVDKNGGKKSSKGIILMCIDPNSQLYDGALNIYLATGYAKPDMEAYPKEILWRYTYATGDGGKFEIPRTVEDEFFYCGITLENVSDQIIYFDKASSGITRNGNYENFFKGVSITQSVSHTKAAGIALPLGVAVGGGTTTGVSTTQTEQRIVAIAPHSKITLTGIPFGFVPTENQLRIKKVYRDKRAPTVTEWALKCKGNAGQYVDINPDLLTLGISIKYSFSEDMENAKVMNLTTHTNRVFCYPPLNETEPEEWINYLGFPVSFEK